MNPLPWWITILITVSSGVLVFVLGQIIQRYALDPLMNYKKARAAVLNHLISSAAVIALPTPTEKVIVNEEFRQYKDKAIELGSELVSSVRSVPLYNLYRKIFRYPSMDDTLVVASYLIDIANNIDSGTSVEHYFRGERKEAFNIVSKILRFNLNATDLELISTGSYRNGKSLEHVIKGVEKALPTESK